MRISFQVKKNLSERDICTKYITPAIEKGGWVLKRQVREEVSFTAGRIIGERRNWLYSKSLFPSSESLEESLTNLVQNVAEHKSG